MYRKILIIFAAALTLNSCFLDEEYNTLFHLQNYEQPYSGDDDFALEGVIFYAFYGNLSDWGVNSYADAVAGVAYDFESGELLVADAISAPDADNPSDVTARLRSERVMILAVDTVNQILATRNYTVGMNLTDTYIFMRWRPWKDESYSENSWDYDHSYVILNEVEEEEEEDN